jgi:hypothetical protein
MIDGSGAFDGMRIGRRNQSTVRKPAPVPFCSPQILHCLTFRGGKPAINRLSYGTTNLRISIYVEKL